jgi:hypothetical protein
MSKGAAVSGVPEGDRDIFGLVKTAFNAGRMEAVVYRLNLIAGWVGILAGFITGAVQGVFFTRPNWLGGYGSWERRMLRLGHIALVALGLINIAFWATAESLHFGADVRFISLLFFAGHVTMPLVCYLAAYRKQFHHAFFIPVLCLLVAATTLVERILQ